MAYTFQELKKKKVGELREIAKEMEHEAVKGYTQMNKDHLLHAICTALGLEENVHHEVKGMDKSKIKAEIRVLKKDREKALEAKDHKQLKDVRTQIKKLKKTLRKAIV